MNSWLGAGLRFQTASAAAHCRPSCFPDTAVDVEAVPFADIAVAAEAAPDGAGIHPMDFLEIVTTACCVGCHLLDLRCTACTFPVGRVCPH